MGSWINGQRNEQAQNAQVAQAQADQIAAQVQKICDGPPGEARKALADVGGCQKAAEIKESLLPNKLESELFAKDGYCGVARYLKAKKLLGKT